MNNIGKHITEELFSRSRIDSDWSVQRENGFTWWAGELSQTVSADPPAEHNGHQLTRVHLRTDVIDGFTGTDRELKVLGLLARFSTVSGWVRAEQEPSRIQLAAAISVHESALGFLTNLLSLVQAIQVAEAHTLMPLLGEVDEWSAARSRHPSSGFRADHDDMLRVVEGLPLRTDPSKWAGDEMEAVAEMLQGPPCVLVNGQASGIAAEFSFPKPPGTSLLRVGVEERHPRLGSGCLFRLTLPESGRTDAAMMEQALELNAAETREHNYFIGSWCPSVEGLTHVSYLPNVAYRPGALRNLTISFVNRARWVTSTYFAHSIDDNYEQAAEDRLGLLSSLGEAKEAAEPAGEHRRVDPEAPRPPSSFHDRLADAAERDRNTPGEFSAAAQKHANAFWMWAIAGVVIWLLFSFVWALIPFALAALAAAQSVSSTRVAKRMEARQSVAAETSPPTTGASHPPPPGAKPLMGVVIEIDGKPVETADVQKVGRNHFRLLSTPLVLGAEEDPPLKYGDVLELQRTGDLRFRYRGRAEVGDFESRNYLLTRGFTQSDAFGELTDHVVAAGGEWEVIAGGLLWVHVPREKAADTLREVSRILDAANDSSE